MTEPLAGPLTRVGGNVALDYANTVSWRGTAQEIDHLRSVDLLLDWFRDSAALGVGVQAGIQAGTQAAIQARAEAGIQAGLQAAVVPAAVVTRLRRLVRSQPANGERLLVAAMRLRGAVTAIGSAVATQASPSRQHLDAVKRAAVDALGSGRIVSDAGRAFRFDFSNAPPEGALLGPIAWAAIDLLRSDQLKRLKRCPACDCRWLFLDKTKNGSRRWCDMATCGNRNKVMRFRRHGALPDRTAQ